jgi:hypothetical protein
MPLACLLGSPGIAFMAYFWRRKVIKYSGYACASWYVTKIEGLRMLSTVESYKIWLAASRKSGVTASDLPRQYSPTLEEYDD